MTNNLFSKVAVDTALIISFSTAIFFISGTVYLENYYGTLGIAYSEMKPPVEYVILNGSTPYIALATAISVLIAVTGLVAALLPCFPVQHVYPIHRAMRKYKQNENSWRFAALALLAFFAALFCHWAISMQHQKGKISAYELIQTCKPDKIVLKNGDTHIGCYVAASWYNYFILITETNLEDKASRTLVIPKDSVKYLLLTKDD